MNDVDTDLLGYCFLEHGPDDFQMVRMSELQPGTPFVFVEVAGLLTDVVLDSAAPAQQRWAVLRSLIRRGRRLQVEVA